MTLDYLLNTFARVLDGLWATTALFLVTIVLSLPAGFLLMLMARCRFAPLRGLARAIIYVIRATPLLLQLLFIYFGLPLLPVVGKYLLMQRFTAAIVGFIINYAAYFAEIFRGGLLAVDKGQFEASHVLGLSRWQTMTRIVIPQLLRVAMPSISNETITLVKDTSLLYAVSVAEILHYAKTTVNSTGDTFAFVAAGVVYLAFNAVVSLLLGRIEKKLEY